MKIDRLKGIVESYNKPNRKKDDNYVSILAVEQVLKEKQNEYEKKLEEYKMHLTKLLNCECDIKFKNHPEDGFEVIFKKNILPGRQHEFFLAPRKEGGHEIIYWSPSGDFMTTGTSKKNRMFNLINDDPVTKEFLSYCYLWNSKYKKMNLGLKTSAGLFIDIRQNMNELKVLLSDANHNSEEAKKERTHYLPIGFYQQYGNYDDKGIPDYSFWYKNQENYNFNQTVKNEEDIINFYYLKDLSQNTREVVFNTDECKNYINESFIGEIYSSLEVDISSFSKDIQDEFNKYEDYYRLKLNEKESSEKEKTKKIQVERVLEAYKELVQAITLLNNLKTEVDLERLKLDDIETIIFKNNRKPNQYGAIEIEDMFKNNMLLRMIDLSNVDLDKVDIRGMDFSNTNIHIDPQRIYNKDMTNVNASGVKFSPFYDKFDDTIIDGAIIDDPEAMINFGTVKSFNDQTIIYESQNKKI